jgi:hypothetical protein
MEALEEREDDKRERERESTSGDWYCTAVNEREERRRLLMWQSEVHGEERRERGGEMSDCMNLS